MRAMNQTLKRAIVTSWNALRYRQSYRSFRRDQTAGRVMPGCGFLLSVTTCAWQMFILTRRLRVRLEDVIRLSDSTFYIFPFRAFFFLTHARESEADSEEVYRRRHVWRRNSWCWLSETTWYSPDASLERNKTFRDKKTRHRNEKSLASKALSRISIAFSSSDFSLTGKLSLLACLSSRFKRFHRWQEINYHGKILPRK